MVTYVAFLRGVNVGGHNRMKMDALVEICESLEWETITTYIQSGNVVFDAPDKDTRTHEASLEDGISHKFEYDISVMVRTVEELAEIVANQPFGEPRHEHERRYVSFLKADPEPTAIESLMAKESDAEAFVIRGQDAYSRVDTDALGSGRSTNIEGVLSVTATRRNWNVVTSVLDLATST